VQPNSCELLLVKHEHDRARVAEDKVLADKDVNAFVAALKRLAAFGPKLS
jgi:hypothetical protein